LITTGSIEAPPEAVRTPTVLRVAEQPPIVALLSWAYTLAITHAYEETHDWFYTNFIQLSCNADYLETGHELRVDFWRGGHMEMTGNNPFLSMRAVGYDSFLPVLTHEHGLESLASAIEHGYYLMVFLDEAQLSYSTNFGSGVVFPHHTLLYGVDRDQEIFSALGFGRGERGKFFGKFGSHRVSFREVDAALTSLRAHIDAGRVHEQVTFFFKPFVRPDYAPSFQVDLVAVRAAIVDYLESTTLYGRYHCNSTKLRFGLGVYDELDRYFSRISEGLPVTERYDMRHAHVLLEHKQVMHDRLLYLQRKELLPSTAETERLVLQCRQQMQELRMVKLLAIKNLAKPDPGYANAMRARLAKQRSDDETLMTGLLASLPG
jgi:hypothetical protein